MELLTLRAAIAALSVLTTLLVFPAAAGAQQAERATVQKRFATKANRGYVHLGGVAPIRDDFYHTLGGGLDAGYYVSESLGLELRWMMLANWEVDAAQKIRRDTGFIPDARPQDMLITAGGRYSVGYGKILVQDEFVVHFDPQLVAGAGVAPAGGHIIPTATFGLSMLTHYAWGIQAKLDLEMALQLENRERGLVASFSFLPVLAVGYSFGGADGGSP